MLPESLLKKLKLIKLLILDVDGVLTDGRLWYGENGEAIKAFHVHDGYGIRSVQKAGITVAIITARESKIVTRRMQDLGVEHVYQNAHDKSAAFDDLLKKLKLTPEKAAYIGDDLPDLSVMRRVGLSIAVANAVTAIKKEVDWHTQNTGGNGAVREICDLLLACQH